MIPLPDPPLVWPPPTHPGSGRRQGWHTSDPGSLVLRPWQLDDAPALVAAWADPEIERWTGVPERRDLAAAERWIAGDEARRRRWLSLDLVVVRDGEAAGEVGLSRLDRERRTADVGWWTAPAHRRQGVASAAALLVVTWAREVLGLSCAARCEEANPGSVAVAQRAGATLLL